MSITTSDDEDIKPMDTSGLVNTGNFGADLAVSYLISEILETLIVENLIIKQNVAWFGDILIRRAYERALTKSMAATGAQQIAAKQALSSLRAGMAPTKVFMTTSTATGAKYAATAGKITSAAFFIFSMVNLMMDIMDVNGYNIILDNKQLSEIKKATEEMYNNDIYNNFNTRQDVDVSALIFDISRSGNIIYSEWGEKYQEFVNEYLESIGFDDEWKNNIQRILDPEVLQVVDPTILEEFFRYNETSSSKKKYIIWGFIIAIIILSILFFGIFISWKK